MEDMISVSSMEWLTENLSIWQHHKVGNFRYVNNDEAKRFQSIAKEIDSDRYFTIYACDKCTQELIRFVFENYEKQINILPVYEMKCSKENDIKINLVKETNHPFIIYENGQSIEVKDSKEISEGTPTAKRKPRKKP